jgi:two-component system, NarL family, response regulator NreC
MSVSVLIADDHQIVRQGLRLLLEREGFDVVAEAADGHEAAQLAERLRPDVAVLDFMMPLLNGLDASLQIQKQTPHTKTILLTMYTEDQYVLEAFRSGLRGYVIKTQAAGDLVRAIREVMRNAVYLSPGISRTLIDAYRTKTEVPADPLSLREREVLQLIAEGKSTKEIATVLGLSAKTAETHRARIMRKLEIRETAGLVRYAIRRGLVRP